MDENREHAVTRTFVNLAGSFANGYDVVDLVNTLAIDSVALLDVAATGLLLADTDGVLHVLAASSEDSRNLELFQLQRREGPCLDCYRNGEAVLVPDLEHQAERWPEFVAGARAAGFASVHSLPMRLRENVLGALGLFGRTVGGLNRDDLLLGQALADVASVALVQDSAARDATVLNQQLQAALSSRVVIEQAKGVLAQLGDLDMNQAFAALRRYVRDHNLRLGAVAQAVVARELPAQQIIDHAIGKGVPRRSRSES